MRICANCARPVGHGVSADGEVFCSLVCSSEARAGGSVKYLDDARAKRAIAAILDPLAPLVRQRSAVDYGALEARRRIVAKVRGARS